MTQDVNRRAFLRTSAAAVAGAAALARDARGEGALAKSRIVVARGGGAPDSEEGALKRMKAALDKWGGFPELVKGKKVLIKINATDGGFRDANTSSQATAALVTLVKDCSPKSIMCIGQEWNGWRAKRQGLPTLGELLKSLSVPVHDLARYWVAGSENDYKLIPNVPHWHELMVAKAMFDDDAVLLNLPRPKTHPHCVFTSCIKNLIGLEIVEPGCRKVRLNPKDVPFDYEAVYPTPLGAIRVTKRGDEVRTEAPDAVEIV